MEETQAAVYARSFSKVCSLGVGCVAWGGNGRGVEALIEARGLGLRGSISGGGDGVGSWGAVLYESAGKVGFENGDGCTGRHRGGICGSAACSSRGS